MGKVPTTIMTLATMSLVAVGTFMGMYTFMFELGEGGYSITVPSSAEGNVTQIMDDLETTSTNLKGSLTGSTSWTQTAFNIFFNTPNNILSTISLVSNSAGKMIGVGTGTDSHLPIPDWVISLVYIFVTISVVGTLIYLALGRRA